jgi:hypothetical protein
MNPPTRCSFVPYRALATAFAALTLVAVVAGAAPTAAGAIMARPTAAPGAGPAGSTRAVTAPVTTPVTPAPTTPTTAAPPTPPTTPPHGGGGPNPTGPTTTVPGTTTLPAPTTTVAPQVVDALLHSVQSELSQLDAIAAYDQDKGIVTVDQSSAANADASVEHANAALAVAAAAEADARAAVDSAFHRLSGVAVALYVRSDLGVNTLAADPAANGTVNRTVLLKILVTHGSEEVASARHELKADQIILRQARQRFESLRSAQAAAHLTLTRSASLLANAKLAAAGRAVQPSIGTPVPTIAGPSALSAGELASWYGATHYGANITVPMQVLASYYVDGGTTEGLRGDIAFAQSIIETGYFTFPGGGQLLGTDNNFAGIGACDTCAHGWRFPDAKTGVAAQLQLLHAYQSTKRIPTPLVGRVGVAGCCATWLSLGGVWASAPDYGYAILTIYKQMLDWAVPQRLAAAGI